MRALDEERPQWLLAAGAATGWASESTRRAALPLLALFLDPRGRRMLRTPWPWARRAALALLLFSPVIAWNVQHGLASFAFQTEGRVAHASFRPLRIARFLGLQAALVTPILLVLVIEAIAQAFRRRADPRSASARSSRRRSY